MQRRNDLYVKVFACDDPGEHEKGDLFHLSEEFDDFPWHLVGSENTGFGRGGTHHDSRSQMSFHLQDSTPFWKITSADSSNDVWEIPPSLWEELQRWYQRGQQDTRREFGLMAMWEDGE